MRVTEAPPDHTSQSVPADDGLNTAQVRTYLMDVFPQVFEAHAVAVEVAEDGYARLRLTPDHRHLRPGGIVSGPTIMMLADAAGYAALLSGTQAAKMAVTTNLNISFVRAGPAGEDIVQDARVVKWGRRLSVLICETTSGGGVLIAHTTMTYAMPDDRAR